MRELERHTFSLAIAPSLRALARRVSAAPRLPRARRAGMRFAGQRWEPCPTGAEAISRVAETGLARGATCAASLSGSPPRDVRALAADLARLGVRLGATGRGLAARPGCALGVRAAGRPGGRCGQPQQPARADRRRAPLRLVRQAGARRPLPRLRARGAVVIGGTVVAAWCWARSACGLAVAGLSGFGGSPDAAPQQMAQVVVLRRAVAAGRPIVAADLAWMRVPAPAPAGQVVDPRPRSGIAARSTCPRAPR